MNWIIKLTTSPYWDFASTLAATLTSILVTWLLADKYYKKTIDDSIKDNTKLFTMMMAEIRGNHNVSVGYNKDLGFHKTAEETFVIPGGGDVKMNEE